MGLPACPTVPDGHFVMSYKRLLTSVVSNGSQKKQVSSLGRLFRRRLSSHPERSVGGMGNGILGSSSVCVEGGRGLGGGGGSNGLRVCQDPREKLQTGEVPYRITCCWDGT